MPKIGDLVLRRRFVVDKSLGKAHIHKCGSTDKAGVEPALTMAALALAIDIQMNDWYLYEDLCEYERDAEHTHIIVVKPPTATTKPAALPLHEQYRHQGGVWYQLLATHSSYNTGCPEVRQCVGGMVARR